MGVQWVFLGLFGESGRLKFSCLNLKCKYTLNLGGFVDLKVIAPWLSNGIRAWKISDHLRIPGPFECLPGWDWPCPAIEEWTSPVAAISWLALSNAVSTSTSSKSKSFLYALVTLVTSTWVVRSLQKIGWVREHPVSIVMWRYIGKNLKKA